MPIPVWLPIALAAASAGANHLGQRKVDKASEEAYRWVEARNDKNIDKAKKAARKTEDLYSDVNAKEAKETQRLSSLLTDTKPVQQANSAVADGGVTDTIVAENNRQKASNKRYTDEVGSARASLLAPAYINRNNAISSMQHGTDITQAKDFMGGDNAVFNTKLQNASTKGAAWGTAGDVLSMAAMLTGMGSLMAPSAGAGAGAAAGSGGLGPNAAALPNLAAKNPINLMPIKPTNPFIL